MAEKTVKLAFTYKSTGATIYACKYNYETDTWENPAEDEGTLLTEVGGDIVNGYRYECEVTKGLYRLALSPLWNIIGAEGVYFATADLDFHIDGTDPDMQHNSEDVKFAADGTSLVSTDVRGAIEEVAGAGFDPASDNSLKAHLDDAVAAHAASAISCSVGAETDVEGALDDHETRISTLEAGTAVTPTGIEDYLGDLGVDVEWDAQDIANVEYAVRYLWKHIGESVPTDYTDLAHERRCLAPETEITYRSRRYDLSSSPDSNLIVYYAIGAKGGADADFTWSAVQSIEVELPVFTQEFRATFSGMAFRCDGTGASGGRSEYFLAVREPNQFPSADATPPTINVFVIPASSTGYQYTEIGFHAEVLPDNDVELILRNSVTGATKTFTVDAATGRIATALQSFLLEVLAGAELQIYTLDAKNMGDVHIWLRRTLYTG